MTPPWREHAAATDELLTTIAYYHRQRAGLGDDFDAEIVAALSDIREWPHSWPIVRRGPDGAVVRSRRVAVFPYRVIYVPSDDEVVVIAYAHERRKPGYWSGRLEG
ncbi:type II toxin-antitoxin system RelE/ParE family toxin [Gryllotalpicola koreensis]|uniref:Type II toxin-antitoxin system RelE/ParE family toxin n=1 Tax=Gryllotalpicola koreensis TaxID=993086 RepID=A0ABP7ZR61_9MICO